MRVMTRTIPRFVMGCAVVAWLMSAMGTSSRARAGEFVTLDLSSHSFRSWWNYQPDRPWNPPPAGRQILNGIPWDISGVVQIFGIRHAQTYEPRPTTVLLPVHARFSVLHLLHFTEFMASTDEPVVRLILHYEGGEETDFVLRQGVHFQVWRYSAGWPPVNDPATALVWQAAPVTELRSPIVTALWHTPLVNPRPDTPVETLELRSLFAEPAYSLAGVTLEQGPARAGAIAVASGHPPLDPAQEPEEQIVRLVDEQDATPLAEAVVNAWVRLNGTPLFWGKHHTDSAGQTTLYLPPGTVESIDLIAVGLEHAPTRFNIPPPAPADRSRLWPVAAVEMKRGLAIGGRVVDGEDNPITGAVVTVGDVAQVPGGGFAGYDWPTVRTDADGVWSIRAAPEEFDRLTLHVSHPEYLPADYEQDPRPQPYAVSRTSLLSGDARLELSSGITLEGLVESSPGVPVPAARITLFDGPTPRSDRRETVADENGRFRVGRLFTGEARLLAQAEGYAPELLPLRIAPGMDLLRLTLMPTPALRLRAGESPDEPLPGVRVMLSSWMGERWLDWSAETDGAGRIDWKGAPTAAEYLILHPDHQPQVARLQPEDGIVNLPLASGGGITGRVLDDDTSEPVPAFTIVPGQSFGPGQTHWERHRSQSGRDGRFTLREDGPEMTGIHGLQRRVMVEAPGYLPSLSEPFSGLTNLVLRLRRGTGPKGVVVDTEGLPVAGADVTLAAGMDWAYMDEPPRFRRMGAENIVAVTAADGSFELPARAEIRGIYAAHESGIGFVAPDELAASSRIVLRPWGRVEGVLKVGDTVTAEQSVSLHSPQGHVLEDKPERWLSVFVKAQPEADGRFVFPLAPPFELEATLEWPPHAGHGMAWSHPVRFKVQPDATSRIVIGGSGRTVMGRVRIEGVADSELDFQRDLHQLQRQPSVRPPAFRQPSRSLSREEMQTAIAEYQERIREFWQSEEGRRAARESGSYILRFQPDGTFRCDHVPPGPYTLTFRFTRPGSEPWASAPLAEHSRELSIAEGDEPVDLGEIVLEARSGR